MDTRSSSPPSPPSPPSARTLPTLKDVARVSGLSLATLDRVLNKRPGVRPATIKRAQDAMRQVGYRPNIAAMSLAKGRPYAIEVVCPLEAPQLAAWLGQAVDALRLRDTSWTVRVSCTAAQTESVTALLSDPEPVDLVLAVDLALAPQDISQGRIVSLDQATATHPGLAGVLAQDSGVLLARQMRKLCLKLDTPIGVLRAAQPSPTEGALIDAFIEALGSGTGTLRIATRPGALAQCAIVLLARDLEPRDVEVLSQPGWNALTIAHKPSETSLDLFRQGRMDALVTWDMARVIDAVIHMQTAITETDAMVVPQAQPMTTLVWSL